MNEDKILELLKQSESEMLEYKSVLIPPQNIAKIIASFANASGGTLIFGITEKQNGIQIKGLNNEVPAERTVNKAILMLKPQPAVKHFPLWVKEQLIYLVEVEKSDTVIQTNENLVYRRVGEQTQLLSPEVIKKITPKLVEINNLQNSISSKINIGTNSRKSYLEHCESLSSIIDNSRDILFPYGIKTLTDISEGKVLMRIIFASFVDMFEKYLSDLLYEIYLAKPDSLRGSKTVTLSEVLDCADIDDFVRKEAKKRIDKFQRGSVKTFTEENEQLKGLGVFDDVINEKIEFIFEIRHLFTHKNGIIDTRFIAKAKKNFNEGDNFEIDTSNIIEELTFIVDLCEKIDDASVKKFLLSTV